MTPKEKCDQLYHDNYMILFDIDSDSSEEILINILSKQLAINTVDEIIDQIININDDYIDIPSHVFDYWDAVKVQLNKL